MKSTLKNIIIALLSAVVTISVHDYFSNDKVKIVENEKTNLIPTTYSFNTNRVAAEMTNFTICLLYTSDAADE